MASSASTRRIVKLLDPATVNKALAEWVLAQSGLAVNRRCWVEVRFDMTRREGSPTVFNSCRVDVELE